MSERVHRTDSLWQEYCFIAVLVFTLGWFKAAYRRLEQLLVLLDPSGHVRMMNFDLCKSVISALYGKWPKTGGFIMKVNVV